MSLVVDNLALAFDKVIFEQVSFELADGEIACLLGASGCGKTSILRCILGFNTPHAGDILLDGVSQTLVPPHKRGIGMVFQDYALFPHLSVADNIAFGLTQAGRTQAQGLTAKDKNARVQELLALIKLNEFANRYPHELSGGQQQRVALARAIAPSPKFVLLDEPFSNLDVALRQNLCDEVQALLKSQGIGAILVTHDQNEAFAMADKIGVMANGRLCSWDTPMQLYHKPPNKLTAGFIGEGAILPILAIDKATKDLPMDKMITNKAVAITPFGAVSCDNWDNSKTHLLVRPNAVLLTALADNADTNHNTAHTKADATTATITAKKFHEGRWLYRLKNDNKPSDIERLSDLNYSSNQDSHLYAELKAYADQDWQVGDKVAVQLTKAWGLM